VIAALVALAVAAGAADDPGYRFARSLAQAGPRPAGSAAERRAHARVEARFRAAGLRIANDRFRVPGHGRSRNVVGIHDTREDCLAVLVAHTDSVPPGPGADDNASGVGTLVALAPRLATIQPTCDVWLIATGAEEQPYTGAADHLCARAAVARVKQRRADLRFVLSLDEVGRGRAFHLRSPATQLRRGVEAAVIRAGRGTVRWVKDAGERSGDEASGRGSGNSDHREFALAGLPAAKLGVPDDPCRHTTCDRPSRLQAGTFPRVRGLLERLLSQRSSSAEGSGRLR
jgi:Zn-dependent M28 family amino/carboxypeptidase